MGMSYSTKTVPDDERKQDQISVQNDDLKVCMFWNTILINHLQTDVNFLINDSLSQ